MPAEPLWAFLRFSPLAYFPRHCIPCSELLICSKRVFCPMAFLFLRICLFVWHCPIILPKVNGVQSLFRCFDYTNIKARIFLFSVDFRIAIKNIALPQFGLCFFPCLPKGKYIFGGKENGNKKKLLRRI